MSDKTNNSNEEFNEEELITLIGDDGSEVKAIPITVFDCDNEEYIAVSIIADEDEDLDEEDEEIIFFKYVQQDDYAELLPIETEEKYDEVVDFFESLIEDADE